MSLDTLVNKVPVARYWVFQWLGCPGVVYLVNQPQLFGDKLQRKTGYWSQIKLVVLKIQWPLFLKVKRGSKDAALRWLLSDVRFEEN